jgi:hypothetical protein
MKESQDIERAKETLAAAQQQKAELEAQVQVELQEVGGAWDPASETLDTVTLRPKRTELTVQLVALAWVPCWKDAEGRMTPAYR